MNVFVVSEGKMFFCVMIGDEVMNFVFVNGFVDATIDVVVARREARVFVDVGYICLKVKVVWGFGSDGV